MYLVVVAIHPSQDPPPGMARIDLRAALAEVEATSREWADAYRRACPHLDPDQDTPENRRKRKALIATLPRRSSSKDWKLPARQKVTSGNWDQRGTGVLSAAGTRWLLAKAGIPLHAHTIVGDGIDDCAIYGDVVGGTATTLSGPQTQLPVNPDADDPPELFTSPGDWYAPSDLVFAIDLRANWRESTRRPTKHDLWDRFASFARILAGVKRGPAVDAEVLRLIPLAPDPDDHRAIVLAADDDERTAPARKAERDAEREAARRLADEYPPESWMHLTEIPGGMSPAQPKKNRKPRRERGYAFSYACPKRIRSFMESHEKRGND